MSAPAEHFGVEAVGAALSNVDAACHPPDTLPDPCVILEKRDTMGGT